MKLHVLHACLYPALHLWQHMWQCTGRINKWTE